MTITFVEEPPMLRRTLLSSFALACCLTVPSIFGPASAAPQPKAPKDAPKSLDLKIDGQLAENDPIDPPMQKPCKTHTMKLPMGKTVEIDLMSTDFDAFLRLVDSAGNELDSDDDSGGNLNARIIFSIPKDDTYKIVATTLDGKVGNYQLLVRPYVEPKATKAKAPEAGKRVTISDKLTESGAHDRKTRSPAKIYEVELDANDYLIDMSSNAVDSYLRILDKNGKELAVDDDSGGNLNAQLTFTPPAAGTYRIVATCLNSGTGDYNLTIENKK
jgi:hypothetical protein